MVVTVSTVKDTLENLRFFVHSNLANGVDHMVIFLDAEQPDVQQWLDTQPAVTCVKADNSWWGGKRPKNLNRRQSLNANATRAALAELDWVDWLFHIDADEVAVIDRDVLAAAPKKANAVRLLPREAVSSYAASQRPTTFKRLLDEGELSLLRSLGVIAEPTNSLHFRSHIVGKVGVRPQATDLRMRHHNIVDSSGTILAHHKGEGLALLHYESWSGADFVRKWTAMIGSGPSINFGKHRQVIADGIRSLLAKDLPPGVAEDYLARLYRTHMADDLEVLRDLDLLIEVNPAEGTHDARPWTSEQREALASGLRAMGSVDKAQFAPPSQDGTRDPSPAAPSPAAPSPAPEPSRPGLFRRSSRR